MVGVASTASLTLGRRFMRLDKLALSVYAEGNWRSEDADGVMVLDVRNDVAYS
jgi:hypothetical protein